MEDFVGHGKEDGFYSSCMLESFKHVIDKGLQLEMLTLASVLNCYGHYALTRGRSEGRAVERLLK